MVKALISNQFVRYVIASAIALCVDYGSYWVIAETTNLALPTAAAIGYSIGLVVAYFLIANRVFKNGWLEHNANLELALFVLSGGLGIAITYAVVYFYLMLVGQSAHLSKLLAVALSFICVFLFRKLVVFRITKWACETPF